MTANDIKQHAHEGIEKLNPMIHNAGILVADAYQLGFDIGLALGEKMIHDICIQNGIDPDQYLNPGEKNATKGVVEG